ncbi:hypothetical protein BXZ70DRAFT_907485 [Cristinia sonorae]|uniref:PPM-type phosphatase domain-containing protein n=1 Tax=Cristinia sonorae TaxID=1940300 RepID=A0A8K0UN40_9AGAR|nr:hypothetical protein BXZ70DRAFT_907485 [Cristinia sonorae]
MWSRFAFVGTRKAFWFQPPLLVSAGVATCGALYFTASHCRIYLDSEERKHSRSATNTSRLDFNVSSFGTSSTHRQVFFGGSDGKITRLLEQSGILEEGSGIARYDFAQASSGETTHEDHSEATVPADTGFWSLFSLFEPSDSERTHVWYQRNLIPAMVGALADLYSKLHGSDIPPSDDTPASEEVEQVMIETFSRLEDDLSEVTSAAPLYKNAVIRTTARSPGNVTLFYDSSSRHLHVASTARSLRAVLGRRSETEQGQPPSISATLLTGSEVDGQDDREISSALPPPSTAITHDIGSGAVGDAPSTLTIQASATSVSIQPGDFLILGSQSIWDAISEDRAVQIVGQKNRTAVSTGPVAEAITAFSIPHPFSWVFNEVDHAEFVVSAAAPFNAAKQLIQAARRPESHEGDSSDPLAGGNVMTAMVIFFVEESNRQ